MVVVVVVVVVVFVVAGGVGCDVMMVVLPSVWCVGRADYSFFHPCWIVFNIYIIIPTSVRILRVGDRSKV